MYHVQLLTPTLAAPEGGLRPRAVVFFSTRANWARAKPRPGGQGGIDRAPGYLQAIPVP